MGLVYEGKRDRAHYLVLRRKERKDKAVRKKQRLCDQSECKFAAWGPKKGAASLQSESDEESEEEDPWSWKATGCAHGPASGLMSESEAETESRESESEAESASDSDRSCELSDASAGTGRSEVTDCDSDPEYTMSDDAVEACGGRRPGRVQACCVRLRCSCIPGFMDPQVISRLREYYLRLAPGDRATFVSERYVCPVGMRTRGSYFLETPRALSKELATVRQSKSKRLPHPGLKQRDCQPVCADFFRFAIGLNKGSKISNVYVGDFKGKHQNPRHPVKTTVGLKWLHGLRKAHLVMPNADLTVLPWSSVMAVHAAFVEELEATDPTCTWAEKARSTRDDAKEIPDPCQQPELAVDPAKVLNMKAADYRYGNPACGRSGVLPILPYAASLDFFAKIWRSNKQASECVIRKWIPFAKCDKCVSIRAEVGATRDAKLRRKLLRKQRRHVEDMINERKEYWNTREMGWRYPRKHLSLIIDGADQKDHGLPHLAERSKTSTEAYKAKIHLTGVIAHGRETFIYTCPGHVKQGHNVTIQAVWDTIDHIKKTDGYLPEVLHMQLDNTTKQNKGRFLAAFAESLVEGGVFKRVYFSFLPVGHTHEDIDQVFSRFSIRLRRENAFSRKHLASQLRAAFTKYGKKPIVKHWSSVANISGWLEEKGKDRISTGAETAGWMKFRNFRFLKLRDGTAVMQAREHMQKMPEDEWGGFEDEDSYLKMLRIPAETLFEAIRDRTIPDAQRTAPNKDWLRKRRVGVETLAKMYPEDFTADDQKDCIAMVDMEFSTEPIKFHWSPESIDRLLPPAAVAPRGKDVEERGEGGDAEPGEGGDDESDVEDSVSVSGEGGDEVSGNGGDEERDVGDSVGGSGEGGDEVRGNGGDEEPGEEDKVSGEGGDKMSAEGVEDDSGEGEEESDVGSSDGEAAEAEKMGRLVKEPWVLKMKKDEWWLFTPNVACGDPFWLGKVANVDHAKQGATVQFWVPSKVGKHNDALLREWKDLAGGKNVSPPKETVVRFACEAERDPETWQKKDFPFVRWDEGWMKRILTAKGLNNTRIIGLKYKEKAKRLGLKFLRKHRKWLKKKS